MSRSATFLVPKPSQANDHILQSSHFYTVDGQILQQAQDNPYLGITFSDDLRWGNTHKQ